MRILVVNWQDWTHPHAGGAEIHLREVFGRIAGRGHRVDLLCVAYEGAPAEERLEGINVIRRGEHYRLFNYAVPGGYRRLAANHYDVVVDDLNKVPFYTPLFVDRPIVALVHHLFGRTAFREVNPAFAAYVWAGEAAVAAVYRRAPFIAVSRSTADDLVRRGIDRGRIEIVHNGLPPLDDEDAILATPKAERPLFVYLGRIKRYKRVDLVVEAFARLLAHHPAARLVVAGDGDHRPAIEARVRELGLEDRVELPGWVDADAKWGLLRRAWALLYLSPKEGWGFSSLEAQRVGTIAIVSDAPGLRDTIVDGETGWAVPHGDVPAVVDALRRAIERAEVRETMERAAVERARGFSWDAAAAATLDVLGRAGAGR